MSRISTASGNSVATRSLVLRGHDAEIQSLEVKALRARGDLHADLPSMRCVGYRQAWEALDGTSSVAELRDKGIFATRQLAKRQITWLRSMPHRRVVACDSPDALQQVLEMVNAELA